jgi:hypothetical protein
LWELYWGVQVLSGLLGRGLDHGGATVAQQVQRGVQRARSCLEHMLSEFHLHSEDADTYHDAADWAAFADGDLVGGVLPLSPSRLSSSVRTGASQPPSTSCLAVQVAIPSCGERCSDGVECGSPRG